MGSGAEGAFERMGHGANQKSVVGVLASDFRTWARTELGMGRSSGAPERF